MMLNGNWSKLLHLSTANLIFPMSFAYILALGGNKCGIPCPFSCKPVILELHWEVLGKVLQGCDLWYCSVHKSSCWGVPYGILTPGLVTLSWGYDSDPNQTTDLG